MPVWKSDACFVYTLKITFRKESKGRSMLKLSKAFVAAACLIVAVLSVSAQKKAEIIVPKSYQPPKMENSAELQTLLAAAVSESVAAVPEERRRQMKVSAALIDVTDPTLLRTADVAGENALYPASVVKMFYMAALERQLEDGKVLMTKELERGLRDMIVDSSNEATQYILDVLTDTASGAEKPQTEFEAWQFKRNRVNRWLTAMGYQNINVNQKTFCEDAYGIEQQSRNYKGENRNMLTANATARMMAEIVLGRLNTPERTAAMMKLMHREPFTAKDDSQATEYTGKALVRLGLNSARLWSKAGWTNTARHDAAYVELPNGKKIVLAVFTEKNADDKELISAIAGKVIDEVLKQK